MSLSTLTWARGATTKNPSRRQVTRARPDVALVVPGSEQPKRTWGLVFEALLGAAACLSLVAVVQYAQLDQTAPLGPNEPPPSVFVQLD